MGVRDGPSGGAEQLKEVGGSAFQPESVLPGDSRLGPLLDCASVRTPGPHKGHIRIARGRRPRVDTALIPAPWRGAITTGNVMAPFKGAWSATTRAPGSSTAGLLRLDPSRVCGGTTLQITPEGPRRDSPGRSEAKAWVEASSRRALKGRQSAARAGRWSR